MLNNKRGLSTVVTTLIIILLVLVAIGIIWIVVRGVIEQGAQQVDVSSKCPFLDITITEAQALWCGNATGSNACNATLVRSAGGDEEGVFYRIVVNNGSKTCKYDEQTDMTPLEESSKWRAYEDNCEITNANKLTVTPFMMNSENIPQLCPNFKDFTLS